MSAYRLPEPLAATGEKPSMVSVPIVLARGTPAGSAARPNGAWLAIGTSRQCHKLEERNDAATNRFVLCRVGVMAMTTGCNTIQGAGKDIEKAGAKIQEEAQEAKQKM
jgi:predicted small secreted protein